MEHTAKEAAAIALGWVQDLYGELKALRVEEVRWDASTWYVTVGWYDPYASPGRIPGSTRPLSSSGGVWSKLLTEPSSSGSARVYKKLEIDDESGEVLGMSIREL